MFRRQFIHASLAAATLGIPKGFSQSDVSLRPDRDEEEDDFRQRMRRWLIATDALVDQILQRQQLGAAHPKRGGFPNAHEIYTIGSAAHYTASLVCCYLQAESRHFQSPKVASALAEAVGFLRRSQHDDGTIDLVSTNFHSPPDTAFAVEPLAMALATARHYGVSGLAAFDRLATEFLQRAGDALVVGGIHTPNHRWVVCMALSWLNTLFDDARYRNRIERWLSERIDIDSDGQYTERSVAGYTPLVNRCLITIGRLLQRPELFDPVRKNLEMSKFYLHSNGQLVTEASRRQDQYRVATPAAYYDSYRYMSIVDQDAGFAAMAKLIEQTESDRALAKNLLRTMQDDRFAEPLPPAGTLPTDYEKLFADSKLARIRRGRLDATVLAENDTLLTYFHGDAALQSVRLASAFFGKGQMVSPTLATKADSYVLAQELTGPYYQPFPESKIPGDGDWHRMPRVQRQKSEIQELASQVTITETDGRLSVAFDVEGTDAVPVAIELSFRHGGQLSGVEPVDGLPDSFLLTNGGGVYSVGEDSIRFGPSAASQHGEREQHRWTQLRGAKPKIDGQSVYITGYTPFHYVLEIGP